MGRDFVMKDIETKEMKAGFNRPDNNLLYGVTIGSILLSLLFMGRRNPMLALFVGLWVPSFLSLGTMMKENKLLEIEMEREGVLAA
jgi:hypothetical protein